MGNGWQWNLCQVEHPRFTYTKSHAFLEFKFYLCAYACGYYKDVTKNKDLEKGKWGYNRGPWRRQKGLIEYIKAVRLMTEENNLNALLLKNG